MKLQNYPILKLLFPYVAGVVLSYLLDYPMAMCQIMRCMAVGAFLLALMLTVVKSYRMRHLKSLVMCLSFVFVGASSADMKLHPSFEEEHMEETADWLVRVDSDPAPRERNVKIEADLCQNAYSEAVKGKVLLYVQSSEEAENIQYGDLLLVHTRWERIASPQNPDAFDNQQYMRRRGIHYSGFVREDGWQRVGHRPANPLKAVAQKARDKLTGKYVETGMCGDELGILKAILLGDDDTLDPELKASYSSAGVSHILCVSGMHVGVIFMIINYLLKPLDLFRSTRIFKTIFVMIVIWVYAHITGLAPSVTRSATMFTFVAIGQMLRRNTNVFHSLFASAYILLLINPLLLFEVGFQLSYLAVSGIVLFQPKLSSFYRCRTKVGNYFWELLTVSVAAQLGTSPISIYYFSQFPNYFVLSNLSVMALSFMVIITGVALLPMSFIPLLSKWLSFLLTWEIRVMNRAIVFVEQLPFSVTENIDYHIVQVLLLYAVIGGVCLLLYGHGKKTFWTTGIFLALFCVSFVARKVQLERETEFVAYHLRKCSVYSFSYGGQTIWLADSIRSPDDKRFRYAVRGHALRHHQQGVLVPLDTVAYDTPFLCKQGNFIRFCDKNFYVLAYKDVVRMPASEPAVKIDCLLLRQNPRMLPEELNDVMTFAEVVADGSNTPFYVERWRLFCESNQIPFTYTGNRKMKEG